MMITFYEQSVVLHTIGGLLVEKSYDRLFKKLDNIKYSAAKGTNRTEMRLKLKDAFLRGYLSVSEFRKYCWANEEYGYNKCKEANERRRSDLEYLIGVERREHVKRVLDENDVFHIMASTEERQADLFGLLDRGEISFEDFKFYAEKNQDEFIKECYHILKDWKEENGDKKFFG